MELRAHRKRLYCQSRGESLQAARLGVSGHLYARGAFLGEFEMANDYIVDEVRRVREEQAAKYAFDVKAILAAAKKRQWRSERKVVSPAQKKKLSA